MLPKFKGTIKIPSELAWVWLVLLMGCFAAWYWFGIWTDNNLEFWLSYSTDSQVYVNNWLSMLIAVCFNAVALVFNIISELIKLVI